MLGQALGSKAIGDEEPERPQRPNMDIESGLVLEQEAPAEARRIEIARKTSPEGALNVLRAAIADDEILKSALWQAIQSSLLTLSEISSLLDIAGLLFDTSDSQGSLVVNLRLPRKYKVQQLGHGRMRFSQSGAVRTKPSRHAPLSAQDWAIVRAADLRYTGPVAKDAVERKLEKKASEDTKPRTVKEELPKPEIVQITKHAGQMSPPPPPPPRTNTEGNPLKLSLKRKQSADAGRAGSPKTQKVQKAQTANGSTVTHIPQRSPSIVSQRGLTPKNSMSSLPKISKAGKNMSKIVKLRFDSMQARASEILSRPAKKTLNARRASTTPAVTPVATSSQHSDGYFPQQEVSRSSQPSSAGGLFSSAGGMAGWNPGTFRSFGGGGDHTLVPIKTEHSDLFAGPLSAISPKTVVHLPGTNGSHAVKEEEKADPTVEPQRKGLIKLKLGKKA